MKMAKVRRNHSLIVPGHASVVNGCMHLTGDFPAPHF